MSQENARAPGLAFGIFEVVDFIKYIVVATPSSTRYKTSCGVYGSCEKSNVLNTITFSTQSPFSDVYVCI